MKKTEYTYFQELQTIFTKKELEHLGIDIKKSGITVIDTALCPKHLFKLIENETLKT